MVNNSDELKPVKCGCGGESFTHILGNEIAKGYYIACDECGTKTKVFGYEAEAIEAWNRAMGTAEKFSTVERTAKVTSVYKPIEGTDRAIHVTCCEKCERVVSIFDDYCPGCGAKLDWSGNERLDQQKRCRKSHSGLACW